MATIQAPPKATARRRRRFTADEFHRMAEAGILGEDERVELLDGEVVEMSPVGDRHVAAVNRCTRRFTLALGERAWVSPQNPVRLDRHNEPEPDLASRRRRWRAPRGWGRSCWPSRSRTRRWTTTARPRCRCTPGRASRRRGCSTWWPGTGGLPRAGAGRLRPHRHAAAGAAGGVRGLPGRRAAGRRPAAAAGHGAVPGAGAAPGAGPRPRPGAEPGAGGLSPGPVPGLCAHGWGSARSARGAPLRGPRGRDTGAHRPALDGRGGASFCVTRRPLRDRVPSGVGMAALRERAARTSRTAEDAIRRRGAPGAESRPGPAGAPAAGRATQRGDGGSSRAAPRSRPRRLDPAVEAAGDGERGGLVRKNPSSKTASRGARHRGSAWYANQDAGVGHRSNTDSMDRRRERGRGGGATSPPRRPSPPPGWRLPRRASSASRRGGAGGSPRGYW